MGRVQVGGHWVEEWPVKGKRNVWIDKFCRICWEVPEHGFSRCNVKKKNWICPACANKHRREEAQRLKDEEIKQMEEFKKWMT